MIPDHSTPNVALIYRTLIGASADHSKDKKRDWSAIDSRYLGRNERHVALKQSYDVMIQKNSTQKRQRRQPAASQHSSMNLYAVKKQQKRVAALLAADREASENHATNKQRRDLIKKRMHNIAQVNQFSKLSKEYKRKYEASVDFYLKDFYEKKDLPGQHLSPFEVSIEEERIISQPDIEEKNEDEETTTVGKLLLGSDLPPAGMPSMTISVNSHKSKSTRKSAQKSILEQVERVHQLRRTSRPDSLNSEDRLNALMSKPSIKSPRSSKYVHIPKPDEPYYKALETKEHPPPMTSDPLLPNGILISETTSQFSAKETVPLPLNISTAPIAKVDKTRGKANDIEVDKSAEPTDNLEAPSGFRHLQAELRGRKKLQPSLTHSFLSTPVPDDELSPSKDTVTLQGRERGSKYPIAAKTSFLSGSFSGPLPIIPSIDLSGTEISSKQFTDLSNQLSRSSSLQEFNSSIRPFSESGKKMSQTGSLLPFVDSKKLRRVRRAGKLQTPTPRLSVSLSRASSVIEPLTTRGDDCTCDDSKRNPRIYKSCRLCYQTFQHQEWCEQAANSRSPHCESCGGLVRGILTPSPTPDADDDSIIITQTPMIDERDPTISEDVQTIPGEGRRSSVPSENCEPNGETSDNVLPNLPIISATARWLGLDDGDDWIDKQLDRRTPSETSSRRMIASPDTMMNHIDSMLGSNAYDYNFTSNMSTNESVSPGRSLRMRESTEDSELTDRTATTQNASNNVVAPIPIIQSQDWSKIHQKAYVAALADARAKVLPLRPEYFGLRTTRSYTSTYFDKLPWSLDMGASPNRTSETNSTPSGAEMKRILGKVNVYDYYPGGKRNHLTGIQPMPKIPTAR